MINHFDKEVNENVTTSQPEEENVRLMDNQEDIVNLVNDSVCNKSSEWPILVH